MRKASANTIKACSKIFQSRNLDSGEWIYKPKVLKLAESLLKKERERKEFLDCKFGAAKPSVLLFGSQAVYHALMASKRSFYHLFVSPAVQESSLHAEIRDSFEKQTELSDAVHTVSSSFLSFIANSQPHQSVAMEAGPLKLEKVLSLSKFDAISDSYWVTTAFRRHRSPILKQAPQNRPPVWIALDHLSDAQNIGNILRTCYCFGVDGVILPSPSAGSTVSVALSTQVAKAASGTLDLLCSENRLFQANTFRTFLGDCKVNGWQILGAKAEQSHDSAMESDDSEIPKLCLPEQPQLPKEHISLDSLQVTKPTVLVLGNESKGLRSSTVALCDAFVSLPMKVSIDSIDSINVSSAASILIYSICRPRSQ